ncbi:MAG: phosphoserine transaminase [Xanthomonadales bacterium]|nr:phosphoserine transaminase [Xanthomonadales bacterium]
MKPQVKPLNPNFSSGPCAKRPGYDLKLLQLDTLGRSHRSALGKARLAKVCTETADILGLPETYKVALVPASDTGAVEMALWSLLGERAVDVLAWESFGKGWIFDIINQLKLEDTRCFEADYGQLPDFSNVDFQRDVVFTWNGTTAGVKVPDGNWIADDRDGLTICDATSAVFAMEMPWEKLDVVTFSWQKVLGGEAAHGMLILSPRAVARLESYSPPWPLPKIFRLTKNGKLNEGIFKGATINTPSMLCVADYLDALGWVKSLGGLAAMIEKSESNLAVIKKFVAENDWLEFLAKDPASISNTSICLSLKADAKQLKAIVTLLAEEGVAFDIGAHRDAPAGLRIWGGATIESSDLEKLMPWISWAYKEIVDC